MVRLIAAALLALAPLAASAQTPPVASGQRGITRDKFVERAAEMAGRRFDEIDTNHTGVITREQLHAWRQSHGGRPAVGPAPTE